MTYGQNVFATGVKRYAVSVEQALRTAGVDVVPDPLTRRELRFGSRRVGGFVSLWAARAFHPSRRDVDLVHALDPAVATRATDVVTVHDVVIEQFPGIYQHDVATRWDWRLTKRLALRVPWVVCVSDATRDEVLARWQLDPERVVTVPSGIDHSTFRRSQAGSPWVAADGRPTLVYVGDDNPRKNLRLAVEAVGRLAERHGVRARFVRVGPSGFPRVRAEYLLRAQAMRVDLVEPGYLKDDELVALLSRARAFLWPTLAEGFGFPPLEAQACGCPVVALDTKINREIVGPYGRYHADDADAAADALASVLERPPAPSDVATWAAGFTWERTAARLRDVYARAIALRRRA